MIKVIIFDLGSVLFKEDWEAIDKEIKRKFGISTLIRSQYGKEINKEYDKTIIGESNMHKVFKMVCAEKRLKRNIQKICEVYKESYKKNKKINRELFNFITKLKENYKVVCFTDTNELHYECHEEQKILDIFDEKFASFMFGTRKGCKETFEKIINQLKIRPEEAIFIDDNLKNIEAAKSIEINAIQFKSNKQLISDLRDLLNLRK